jgi:hypothetical protein
MTVQIATRPYGPSSTPEEIAALKERVYVLSPGVIMYREVPIQTVFQLDRFEEKLNELAAAVEGYALVIDLTEAEVPGAAIRARLKKLFGGQPKLGRTVVYTGKNFMLNVAAKFVLGGAGLRSFSVHKTREQALDALAALAS